MTASTALPAPVRIGVLTQPLGREATPALRYLILHLNTLLRSFEFELIDLDSLLPLLQQLASRATIDCEEACKQLPASAAKLRTAVTGVYAKYKFPEPPPKILVILSLAQFDNDYWIRTSEVNPGVAIIALGGWRRTMAPPSLTEFFLVILLAVSVKMACHPFRLGRHLGTKGCLFDFNRDLSDARYHVLGRFICRTCSDALVKAGRPHLKEELLRVLSKEWLGKMDDPQSPAAIAAKLGVDLFVTKGLQPTVWEQVTGAFQKEGVNQVLKIVGTLIGAALLVHFGLKAVG